MFDRMIFKGRLIGLYKPCTVPAPLAQRTPRTSPPHRAHTSRTPTPPRPHRRRILDQLDALLPETPEITQISERPDVARIRARLEQLQQRGIDPPALSL